jgi:hypothetical protein
MIGILELVFAARGLNSPRCFRGFTLNVFKSAASSILYNTFLVQCNRRYCIAQIF